MKKLLSCAVLAFTMVTASGFALAQDAEGQVIPEAELQQSTAPVVPEVAEKSSIINKEAIAEWADTTAASIGNNAAGAGSKALEFGGTAKTFATGTGWPALVRLSKEQLTVATTAYPNVWVSASVVDNIDVVSKVVAGILLVISLVIIILLRKVIYKAVKFTLKFPFALIGAIWSVTPFGRYLKRRRARKNAENSGSFPPGTPITYEGITVTANGDTTFTTEEGTVLSRNEYAKMVSAGRPEKAIGGLMVGSVVGLPMKNNKGKIVRANLTLEADGDLNGTFAGQGIDLPMYAARCYAGAIVDIHEEGKAKEVEEAQAAIDAEAKAAEEAREQEVKHAQELDDARQQGAAAALENQDVAVEADAGASTEEAESSDSETVEQPPADYVVEEKPEKKSILVSMGLKKEK